MKTLVKIKNPYYYTSRMQISTSVFKIWWKSPRAFVIPLQSSRKFVYS